MRDIFGMVKNAIGIPGDEYEDFDEDENLNDDRRYTEYRQETQYEQRRSAPPAGKVISMPTELSEMKVAVLSPSKYDDARLVCDNLKAWAPVIVNLNKMDKYEAQRVVDFIMGACYTLDGHVEEVREDVFLVTPSMVNIEKEFDDPKVKSGSFFSKFAVR